MKCLVFGNLQQNDLFGDFYLNSSNCNDFIKSQEFNGLGTFSYGLHLSNQDVTEYRSIPFKNYHWDIRKHLCKFQLELESVNPKISLNRISKLNQDFYQFIENNSFDTFFTREIFSFTKEYLEFIKKSFSIRILWLSFSPGLAPFEGWQDKLSYFTHIFLVDQKGVDFLKKKGYNAYYLPFAMSDFKCAKYAQNKKYSVGFIGTIYPDRMKLLNALTQFDFHFWSGNFEEDSQVMYPDLLSNFEGKAWGNNMLVRTAEIEILINPIHRGYMLGQEDNVSNFRNFECIGTNTFQISEDKQAIRDIFDEDEIAFYKDIIDLNDKLKFYLKHKDLRQKMLNKAFNKVSKDHMYSHRMKKIINILK
ncbi:MAG: hypothetical protein COB02_16535 [Candidatus Cloacimonadota bacterium]|nr:MAG: hypothetical protein COB02_16535 [Candidatus Cloacimonadota bacterium]